MLISNIKELEKDKSIHTYSCGSQKLSHEIRTRLNIVPVNVYKHKKTGKLVNVFIMTDELSRFLTEWSKNKPKNQGEVSCG